MWEHPEAFDSPGGEPLEDDHQPHEDHGDHQHGPDCGHEAVEHDGHTDYVHDGHRHWWHHDHWDDH
jgi:hypothetical protein